MGKRRGDDGACDYDVGRLLRKGERVRVLRGGRVVEERFNPRSQEHVAVLEARQQDRERRRERGERVRDREGDVDPRTGR